MVSVEDECDVVGGDAGAGVEAGAGGDEVGLRPAGEDGRPQSGDGEKTKHGSVRE